MSDMSEFWKAGKEDFKKRCAKRNEKYEPQLVQINATEKAQAVWEIDGWFCYPSKGFAMNKFNPDERMNLQEFINKKFEEQQKGP